MVGPGEAEQPAMVIYLASRAVVETLGDAARAIRIAGQKDEGRVVALLGAKVDL